jgi:ATP-dependent Lhr-like helicase
MPAESDDVNRVLDVLRARGACFVHEVAAIAGLEGKAVRAALGQLVAAGLVASDGFGGLRSILRAAAGSPSDVAARATVSGRWSVLHHGDPSRDPDREAAVEVQASSLLRRYGVVFRKLLVREANAAPWRELARVYRRLEARGDIRGGRFVAGMSGEQFALPDAVEQLREIRRTTPDGRLIAISAADPLNLAGIITTGDRVRAVAASRVVYRDGVPLAALEGDYVRPLVPLGDDPTASYLSEVATVLAGRARPPVLSGFVGR